MRQISLLITALLMGFGLLVGAASAQLPPAAEGQTGSPAPAAPAPAFDSSYVIGGGDVVEISLIGRGDFTSRVRVGMDGTVLLPLVGRIPAADRTALELSEDIRQALIKGGFYSDAVVRVEVVGISSRYATVLGFVGSPGLLPLDRNYRLSEVLARVGGRAGAGADFVVLTRANGETKRYSIDVLASGGPDQDPLVTHGDKIFIPAAENEVFYISGQVNSPGAYPVSTGMTFRKAIARGGGVTENGSEGKVKVVRDGKKLSKVKLEDTVQVGDVITIGERLF